MRTVLTLRTVLKVGKKSQLFPGIISQCHPGSQCLCLQKGPQKNGTLARVSHLVHTLELVFKLDLKEEPFGPPTTLAPTNDAISGSGRKQNLVGKKKNFLSWSEDVVCR